MIKCKIIYKCFIKIHLKQGTTKNRRKILKQYQSELDILNNKAFTTEQIPEKTKPQCINV